MSMRQTPPPVWCSVAAKPAVVPNIFRVCVVKTPGTFLYSPGIRISTSRIFRILRARAATYSWTVSSASSFGMTVCSVS